MLPKECGAITPSTLEKSYDQAPDVKVAAVIAISQVTGTQVVPTQRTTAVG